MENKFIEPTGNFILNIILSVIGLDKKSIMDKLDNKKYGSRIETMAKYFYFLFCKKYTKIKNSDITDKFKADRSILYMGIKKIKNDIEVDDVVKIYHDRIDKLIINRKQYGEYHKDL